MSKTTLNDLRSHLFDAIERVKSINDENASENEKMSIDQAKAICQISEQIIESAKVEVDAMRVISKSENKDSVIQFANKTQLFIDK